MTSFLTAVRHEVNNLESSVVVQELEFAINRALYGLKICFVCAYKVEPNSNQSQDFISYGQEEGRIKKQYKNQT